METESPFKITIHMVASLDGMIAAKDNDMAWFETVDRYDKGVSLNQQEITDFLATIDCYVMGAKTYEHGLELAKTHGWLYGNVPVVVLSSRKLSVEKESISLFSGDLQNLVTHRLKPNYKNIWMVGGADLAKDFIRQRLADEIRMSVIPVILGGGKRFFDEIGQEQPLHLLNVTPYKNGIVELHYELRK